VPGGAYGPLCRVHGLAVDHLYAVEVVVVDRAGRVRAVVATREPSDPHRELWWAHTGGGGGTFGVVTRYWFRTPGAEGDPSALLPAPPASVLTYSATWRWADLDREAFTGLVRAYGDWVARNSAVGTPAAPFYGEFILMGRASGTIVLQGQVAAPPAEADRLLDGHLAALAAGSAARPEVVRRHRPWLAAALAGSPGEPGPVYRLKVKSAFAREPLSPEQVATAHRALSGEGPAGGGMLSLNTYGGQVNAAAPGATAVPHRGATLLMMYAAGWERAADDARNLAWIRDFYRDMHARTGGVPAPADGCFLNYPDADLADPRHNTSGVSWQALYFGDGHARLQRAKARFDPGNVFHHALSVRA
jgi:FAD/FMN-containing dehydrogenase